MRRLVVIALRLLLPRPDREHVLAELDELRVVKAARLGPEAADAWFRKQAIIFIVRILTSRTEARTGVPQRRPGGKTPGRGLHTSQLMDLSREVEISARTLLRARGFLALTVSCLALGLGAATAIFSIANALLLRPQPFQDPERIVGLMQGDFGNHSYPNFLGLQEECASFMDLAAYDETWYGEGADKPVFLREGANATQVSVGMVSGEYFSVLGVAPVMGRPLLPRDNLVAGGNPVTVLSWSFWQRQFGEEQGVVGREIDLSGTTYEIVGVAPEGFLGTSHRSSTDLWIPAVMRRAVEPPDAEFDIVTRADWHWVNILGRLKPGVAPEIAKPRLDAIVKSSPLLSEGLKEDSISLRPIKEAAIILPLRERTVSYLRILLFAVGLVVVVVCVNVTSLFLGRLDERRAEISVRTALGAGRSALARQFILEATLVAGIGGLGAFLLSLWFSDLLFGMMARGMRLSASAADLSPDPRVFLFTLGLVAGCSLVIGGVTALRYRPERVGHLLRPGVRVPARRSGLISLPNLLVTAQVAVSIVLLVGAGLMFRSFLGLQDQEFGLEYRNTLALTVDNERLPLSPEAGAALYERVLERIQAVPGVEDASLAKVVPLSGVTWGGIMEFEGYDPGEGERARASENYVDPGFFEMMGIEVLQGRGITKGDVLGSEGVVVVNEALVRRYWPDVNPLGRTVRWWDGQVFRVVGVVGNHFYSSLRRGVEPLTYYPLAQQYLRSPTILARGSSSPTALGPAIREAVAEIHPDLTLFNETTLEALVEASASRERVTTVLLFSYAGLALLLAIIGTYGVTSRMVVRRWKEIGIRTALGAQRGEVASLIFRTGMRVVVFGLVTGLVSSMVVGVLLRSMIFGVAPADPLTLAAVGSMFLAAGAAACLIPIRRALGADPAEVLRGE